MGQVSRKSGSRKVGQENKSIKLNSAISFFQFLIYWLENVLYFDFLGAKKLSSKQNILFLRVLS